MTKDRPRDGVKDVVDGNVPRDPAVAGFVGKRRAVTSAAPDPNGNREARRAYARLHGRLPQRGR